MLFSKQLTRPTMVLVGFCIACPFLSLLHPPLFNGLLVQMIEDVQALMLLVIAFFCYFYIRPDRCSEGKKQFWFWAILWWIMLFGRSISWGRDYFPEVQHVYFRIFSIFFIAPVVLMLFSKALRQEILLKFKTVPLPIYSFALALVTLIIADSIEHSRLIMPIFLYDLAYKDFMEEMYEFPVIWGLFEITFLLMKQEKLTMQAGVQTVNNPNTEDLTGFKNVH